VFIKLDVPLFILVSESFYFQKNSNSLKFNFIKWYQLHIQMASSHNTLLLLHNHRRLFNEFNATPVISIIHVTHVISYISKSDFSRQHDSWSSLCSESVIGDHTQHNYVPNPMWLMRKVLRVWSHTLAHKASKSLLWRSILAFCLFLFGQKTQIIHNKK
jgi:hypothetical protein